MCFLQLREVSNKTPLGGRVLTTVFLLCTLLFSFGCQTPDLGPIAADHSTPVPLTMSAGDTLQITFPGAPALNGTHRIGPDGMITLPHVGQVEARGKTAGELQAELTNLFETQLQENEVLVTLVGSANLVYVNGAVLRPGRILLDRPLTVLEAIMESGGFNPVANLEKVGVIRYEGDQNVRYNLNLEPILSGGQVTPFYVKPRDIIVVPEKTQWF